MTAPTLEEGPYIFNVNNAYLESTLPDGLKRTLLGIKDAVVGLGGAGTIWKVVASCNSVTVWNIDPEEPNRDLWLTLADLVDGTSATAHSWVVIENQTTGAQLSIEYVNIWSANDYCVISFSAKGTYSNDGTTTARPSCTDEVTLWLDLYRFCLTNSAHRGVAIHAMASANHKTLRVFTVRKDSGDGEVGAYCILIEELADTPAQWTSTIKQAVFYHSSEIAMTTTPENMSPAISKADGTDWRAFIETAEPSAEWLSCQPIVQCYGEIEDNDGLPIFRNSVNQTLIGGLPVSPITLLRGRLGVFGRIKDLYFAPPAHNMYDTYPLDESRTWIKIGCFLVPWNGAAPLYGE